MNAYILWLFLHGGPQKAHPVSYTHLEGWTNLNPVAEEMKNPGRDLPRALILGIGAIMVIYVLFNFAIYRVLPQEQIEAYIGNGDIYLGTHAADTLFGGAGQGIILATQLIAIFGSLNGMIIAFPRYYYDMAAEKHFFKNHASLNKYGVPQVEMCIRDRRRQERTYQLL